jgi:hypothetical protein
MSASVVIAGLGIAAVGYAGIHDLKNNFSY